MLNIIDRATFSKILVILGVMTGMLYYILALDSIQGEVAEVDEVVLKPVDPKQLACMATNIYYEARNESVNGQAAIARVVLNRVRHGFAGSPCTVIYQKTPVTKTNENDEQYTVQVCQFSWVCEGKGLPNKNDPKYKRAEEIAFDVLSKDAYRDIVPTTALFFHNLSVDPFWPYKQVAKIGNHIFYSKAKKQKKVNADETI